MKRVAAIGAAMVLAGAVCFAEEASAQKPAEAPKAAAVERKAGVSAAQEEMWKKAGCTDEEIAKLKELQKQFMEARKNKDQEKAKQIREEMDKIMTPERKAKLRELRAEMKPKAKDAETTKK